MTRARRIVLASVASAIATFVAGSAHAQEASVARAGGDGSVGPIVRVGEAAEAVPTPSADPSPPPQPEQQRTPPDAAVIVRIRSATRDSVMVTLSGSYGTARCGSPCRIPVVAGPHRLSVTGAFELERPTLRIPRGSWQLNVTGPDSSRRTGGIVMTTIGGVCLLTTLITMPIFFSMSYGGALALLIDLPIGILGTALFVPGVVLVTTSGPDARLEPLGLTVVARF